MLYNEEVSKRKALQCLHDTVDKKAATLELIHSDRLQCANGCHDCCQDDLSVFVIEAERIRTEFGDLLEHEQPHPEGKCAFLDQTGSCRIYAARPYVCRTQGLPLRWQDDSYEYRDICPLNEDGTPVEKLPSDQCWTLGEFEGQLAQLQGDLKRVKLRDLFFVPSHDSERADK